MKKLTKILLVIFVLATICAIILGRDVFNNIIISNNSITFNPTAKSISGLVLLILSILLGTYLYWKFVLALSFEKMVFFASVPIVLIYGILLFLLAYLSNLDNQYADFIKSLLNINTGSDYNTILWAILISIVFLIILYFNYLILCKPVNKLQHVVLRLGDGNIKDNNVVIGGGRQFKTIEHSLNKINNNYKTKDRYGKTLALEEKNILPKQLYKFLGRDGIDIIEREGQVKKRGTIAIIKLSYDSKMKGLQEQYDLMNAYMNQISPLIKKAGGFIDKFLGDALVAVFARADSALDCCKNILRIVGEKNKHGRKNIYPGIALHDKDMTFAFVGEKHSVPTIVSSLEEVNKISEIGRFMKSKLIFSKSILDNLPLHYNIEYRYLGSFTSSDKKIMIFEDISIYPKPVFVNLRKNKNLFEKGVFLYNNKEFEKAVVYFEDALRSFPQDGASYIYFNKAKEKLASKLS